MNRIHKTRLERSGLLPVFSKLFGMLAVLFLVGVTSCSKDAPIEGSNLPPAAEPMNLKGVDVDLEAGLITGTTAAMEYSLNSTNGVDGTWTVASDGNTAVIFVPGKVFVREAGNHDNARMVVAFGPGMIIIVDLEAVGINITEGLITGTASGLEYSLNSTNGADGDWAVVSEDNTEVEFVAGNVYVRDERQPNNVRLVATIAPAAAAPTLIHDDDTNTIIGLSEVHEYKINDREWTAVIGTPIFWGDTEAQVRVKATVNELASEIQTINFTATLVFHEDFEGYSVGDAKLWLTSREWTGFKNDDRNPPNFGGAYGISVDEISYPHGGNNSLHLQRQGNVAKEFALTQNVILEWKMYRMLGTSATRTIYISLFNDSEEVVRLSAYNFLLRAHKTEGSTATTASTYHRLMDELELEKWDTYRIVLNGDRYEVYAWDEINNEYRRLEVEVDGVIATDFATIDERKGVNRVVFDQVRNAEHVHIDDVKIIE